MAKRGPKPRYKVVTGEKQTGTWECPPDMDGELKEVWTNVVQSLRERGSLDCTDPHVVEAYVSAIVTFRSARRQLSEIDQGVFIESAVHGKIAHPAVRVAESFARVIKSLGRELGLTPSSRRTVLPSSNGSESGTTKWDGLLDIV